MKRISGLIVMVLAVSLASADLHAKKYKAINEIPGQVPETDEERGIWQLGIAHQEKVRGTDELVNDAKLEAYLEGIIAGLMGDMLDSIGMEVDVLVFRDPTVNAWVYPNGTVAVQTGLLAAMQNEAQLASILGHEVSHFLNRHAFIQIKSKQKQSLVGKGLGVLATAAVAAKTGALNTGLLSSGQLWTELVTSGYSRKLETAADSQGLAMMMAAGYPPDQAIPAFEQLRIKDDDQINVAKMWSSHPDIDARKKNLKRRIKKAKGERGSNGMDEKSYLESVALAVLINSQLWVQNRDFDKAVASLKGFTEILPDDARGHYFLGEVYRQQSPQGNFEARISAYQQAVSNDASLAEPYKELGMVYRQQGQQDKAREAFDRYLSRAPQAFDAPIIKWYRDNLESAVPATRG